MAGTRAGVPERIFHRPGELQGPIGEAIGAVAGADGSVKVLEAGCGPRWDISVPGASLRITGLDLDEVALRRRVDQEGDLEDWIIGDLRSVDLPGGCYDVVYCSYVLEHVEGAEQVLDRLIASLRPGGRLVVRIPDGDSVYGWAARHSSFRVQVAYKRYVEGHRNAGKPGHAPYPVVYDSVISLAGMRRFAAERGLRTVLEAGSNSYVRGTFRTAAPVVQRVLDALGRASRGRVTSTHNNLILIYEVPATPRA